MAKKRLACSLQYPFANSIVISAEQFSFLENYCVLKIPRNGKAPNVRFAPNSGHAPIGRSRDQWN